MINNFMESKSAIVDPIHIIDDQAFTIKETIIQDTVYIVQNTNICNQYFLLVKKSDEFISHTNYQFINHCEKSFELIHPSIINLSGFSIQKPYLYYNHIPNSHNLNDIELTNLNIQKIFLGLASGLSYLLSKGYYYTDFSFSSILFDENNSPKLFDYINFDNSKKETENDLIIKYAKILKFIIDKKLREDSNIIINIDLKGLIDRCQYKTNLPTFEDFIVFFESDDYCYGLNIVGDKSFQKYLEALNYADKIVFDEKGYFENSPNLDSFEQLCFYFYRTKSCGVLFGYEDILAFNSLPEHYIMPIARFHSGASNRYKKYLCYFDLSLTFPDWKRHYESNNDKNPFLIYKNLKNSLKTLLSQLNSKIYSIETKESLVNQIDALRIQAIHFLKKACKRSNNAESKIELSIQYIKGIILPYNLTKALEILNSIVDADEKTLTLIDQMKKKVSAKIQSNDQVFKNISQEQREILQKAEKGNVLCLLYCAFSFFTGFNDFPILRSLSISYYRKAARMSSHAMYLLGLLYFKGIIFPQNFHRAKNCFKRAAIEGYCRAEIIDCLLRKHFWRQYLLEDNISFFFKSYLPSFESIMPNHSFILQKINYFLDSGVNNDYVYNLSLLSMEKLNSKKMYSERVDENYHVTFTVGDERKKSIHNLSCKSYHSQKILLSSENIEDTNDPKEQMFIAMSYFYGDNNFPINYSKAAKFFKLAADNGNSEAQWRYAMMCLNSLGVEDGSNAETYFEKSAKQNNLRGKLLYALYLRNHGNMYMFDKLINECCNSGSLDAIYCYAMHIEKVDKSLEYSLYLYQNAADKGHFDSLIRLIYILRYKSKTDLYEHYLNLSVAILNESLLVRLIDLYDRKKQYNQSNILIQIGNNLNFRLFNAFYCDHLLYAKGMQANEKRAEKFAILSFNEDYMDYMERYIYVLMEILIRKKKHQKAATFIIKNMHYLTERCREKFVFLYQKLDKNIAHQYSITINFTSNEYRYCYEYFQKLVHKEDIVDTISRIQFWAGVNPYASAMYGKILKQGKYVLRDLKKAVKYFALSAAKKCPEGYYYIGKEYLYGRIIEQKIDLAKKYFLLALKNYGDPRAGYYLYKIPGIRDDQSVDDVESLKISAYFGYKRGLYKYGCLLITGKDDRIAKNKSEGRELIQQAAYQNYKKAEKYCKLHGIERKTYFVANNISLKKKINVEEDFTEFEPDENTSIDSFNNTENDNDESTITTSNLSGKLQDNNTQNNIDIGDEHSAHNLSHEDVEGSLDAENNETNYYDLLRFLQGNKDPNKISDSDDEEYIL